MKFILALLALCALGACAPARQTLLPLASPQLTIFNSSPLPTPTQPLPTLSAPPTTVPIQSVRLDHLPKISHDLVFVNDFALKRWDHLSGKIEILTGPANASGSQGLFPISFSAGGGLPVGGVGRFSVSTDGQKIVFERRGKPNVPYFEIALLDMKTRQITTLLPNYGGGEISLSPDGEWLGFLADHLYAVRITDSKQRLDFGSCSCSRFWWLPDSQTILWNSKTGMWSTQPGQPGHRVARNELATPTSGEALAIHPYSLSPGGRYILTGISAPIEGGSIGVVDIQTGRVAELKDSFQYVEPVIELSWLQDDRLLVIRDSRAFDTALPSAEVWHLDPTQDSMLIRDVAFALGFESSIKATALTQLSDGRLMFAAVDTSGITSTVQGLYTLDLQTQTVHKLNNLPADLFEFKADDSIYTIVVIWSPDGTEAIAATAPSLISRGIYYIPLDGGPISELRQALGSNAAGFTWIK